MNMPKISVIMGAYNAERYLRGAVESILVQTFADFEFIVIDDGSTDSTADILASFPDARMRIIRQKNQGLTKSLNRGLAESRGTYIARMDADDLSLPERFEKQIAFLDAHPDIGMCGTQAEFMDEDGNPLGRYAVPQTQAQIVRMMPLHNPFIHPSVCIRKKVFERVGNYDERFLHAQDYELWTRIVPLYETANLPDSLMRYRVNGKGTTQTKKRSLRYKLAALHIRSLFVLRLCESILSKPFRKEAQ